MSIMTEIRQITLALFSRFDIPKIAGIVFPPFFAGGQPREYEFMALTLEGGAGGLSFVLLPDSSADSYRTLNPRDFLGTDPMRYVEHFGGEDPVANMLGLAAINATCQQVMRLCRYRPAAVDDSLGLLQIEESDRIGMVGFFPPLLKYVSPKKTDLIIVEKNPRLIERYPHLPMTLDIRALHDCNKILCTGTTVLNDSLDNVLDHCTSADRISVLGPTAGYFPDPLFKRGVDVLGGRVVDDGMALLKSIEEGRRWGAATRKICFQAVDYKGIDKLEEQP